MILYHKKTNNPHTASHMTLSHMSQNPQHMLKTNEFTVNSQSLINDKLKWATFPSGVLETTAVASTKVPHTMIGNIKMH